MKRVLLLTLLVASSVFAKPLYITVPRTYGTDEAPLLNVSFAEREAVELRVLKPKNLDAFLASQETLRRAYDPPSTFANPGRALSRGLNGVRNPADTLRFALNLPFRAAIVPALEASSEAPKSPVKLAEGPERLVGVPENMTMLRSHWLNLDLGGAERDFNVPGFEAWSGHSGFQDRNVVLDPLPAGIYVVQMVQGAVEGQVVLVVSDLSVVVKQASQQVLVRVAGRDQQAKAGVSVNVRAGPKTLTATTDANGEATVQTAEPRLLVTATQGEDSALVDTDYFSTLAIAPDVFLYSDRPIYKPRDTVRFRGVLRQPENALARLFMPKTRDVQVALVSTATAAVKGTFKVDEFGAFSGQLVVPAGLDTGVLRLVATVDGPEHQAEMRVQEYVKPTFFVEVLSDDETVTPGQKLAAHVRVRRYSGGVPANTKFTYFLYRTQVDAPAWVDDSGLGAKGSEVTYGTVSTNEGTLSVPQKLFASEETGFDAAGEADISVDVPALRGGDERKPWRYSLSVRAKDDQGTFANAALNLFLAESDLVGSVSAKAKVVKPGDTVKFTVRATTLSGKPYGVTTGHVQYRLRGADGKSVDVGAPQDFSTGDDGVARLEVKADKPGVAEAAVTLADKKGHSWADSATSLVLGDTQDVVMQVPALALEALGGVLETGDTAELVALLPAAWASKEGTTGSVWVTLTGSSIFKTERVSVKGQTLVYRFPIEKRFGSAVYASVAYPTSTGRWEERIATFRVVPRERALTVRLTAERVEAAPLTFQTLSLTVTDSNNQPVQAEVSVGVVDKAVYALQSELRPGIIDFFYPQGRDDVSTFSSSDFQGYGYGDRLAMKLARMPKHAFAAVKPPTKRQKEDDTVYWNPAVRTDRDGRASVRFKLNSMQTVWTATAVAVDASGRFGETTSEFATRGALVVSANLPQFMRQGDTATGSIRVTPGMAGPGEGTVQLDAALTGVATGAVSKAIALGKGSEAVVPLELVAAKTGEVQLTVHAKGIGEPISDMKRVTIEPTGIDEVISVSQLGGGSMSLAIPLGSEVISAQLRLAPTMVDVALTNARDLLVYPHGCIEQLVSTTIPNVALYRTLGRLNALETLDKDNQQLLVEARSRAVNGIARILDLEVKGGGFVWFSGYATPSLEMTMIALDGLGYAVEAGLLDKNDARLTESANWLDGRKDVPDELESTRTYVLARLQGPKQAARVRAQLSGLLEADLHALALTVLAAEYAQVAAEPEFKDQVAKLAGTAHSRFVANAAFHPHTEAFFRYPLRNVGFTAILAHAATHKEEDLAPLRSKLLQLLSNSNLSTFDRGTALLHSQWLIEHDLKALKKVEAPKVEGGGVTLARTGFGFSSKVDEGASSLKVAPFEGVAVWKATVRTPLDRAQARSNGMTLTRTYYAIRKNEKALLLPGESLKQGDDLYVELTFDARDEQKWRDVRSAYYVVEDPIPAGFTVLQEDKAYRGAPMRLPLTHESLRRRAFSPERMTWYFEEKAFWSASARTIGYVVRAQFPGTFKAPPATIEDMYASEVNARTESASLSISK